MMNNLLVIILSFSLVISVMACTKEEEPPTFQPLATPTTPPDFVVFTDETSAFSISYPPDWELALSQMSVIEEESKKLLSDKDSELPLGNVGFLFFAGLNIEEVLDPSSNVVAESLDSEMNANEYAEVSVATMKNLFKTLKANSQTNVSVGGRKGVILDWEIDMSEISPEETGTLRSLQLLIGDGSIAWVASCGMRKTQSPANVQVCEDVVRSFRILE